jgi:hypothetical protein
MQLEQADVIWRSQVEREVSLGFRVVHIDNQLLLSDVHDNPLHFLTQRVMEILFPNQPAIRILECQYGWHKSFLY